MKGDNPDGIGYHADAIESVLDECLRAIQQDHATVAECLARYPDYAQELEPLLEIALAIENVGDISPSEEFKQATRARLLLADQKAADGKAGTQASDGAVGRVTFDGKGYDPLTEIPPGRFPRSRRSKMD